MTKILFICHGNICRSPMAEFIFKDKVKKLGLENNFFIASAATSTEEIGNRVHYGTAGILRKRNIDFSEKRAVRVTKSDYEKYDYIVCMDKNNLRNIKYIIPDDPHNKISLLMSFAGKNNDVADPWYTGDFDITERDIDEGCDALFNHITKTFKSE